MLRTSLCELLAIETPIIQAGMGPFGSGAELAAAVSNAGAIGTLGGALRPAGDLANELSRMRELTERPYIVNFTQPALVEDSLAVALKARPPAISLALGDPGDLVQQAHDAGILFIQQVHTVQQARQVAERGVDVIIAQGTEAGGFGGVVSTMVLVPQVVDAVAPIPVVAAGGIADGRGLAACLALGAQGANIGTRFLASQEATISDDWKQAIIAATSVDAVKVDAWNDIFPRADGDAFDVAPRAIRTIFVEHLQQRQDEVARESARLQAEIIAGVQQGRMYDFVPFSGQTVGLITEILPAGEIVRRIRDEAEACLAGTGQLSR